MAIQVGIIKIISNRNDAIKNIVWCFMYSVLYTVHCTLIISEKGSIKTMFTNVSVKVSLQNNEYGSWIRVTVFFFNLTG